MEAVIGIRDAGKTKKPPDVHSLHSEPMGDGLYARVADAPSILIVRRIALDCTVEAYLYGLITNHPTDWPSSVPARMLTDLL